MLTLTASCALSAIIGIHGLALPAHAITTEQLLFLEAWRAIDRAYVDKSFNNQSWFKVRHKQMHKTNCCCRDSCDAHSETAKQV